MGKEPRGKIEIIPPDEDDGGGSPMWISRGSHHVRIVKLGPLGTILALGAVALITALGFMFLSGLFLILIPVVLLVGAGAWLSGLLGGSSKRLR